MRNIESAVDVALAGPLAERRHLGLPPGCVTAGAARDLRHARELLSALVGIEGGWPLDVRLLHHAARVTRVLNTPSVSAAVDGLASELLAARGRLDGAAVMSVCERLERARIGVVI